MDETDTAIGRVLYSGQWRFMSMMHQQGAVFRDGLRKFGYEVLPTCNGCKMGDLEVRDWNGSPWHFDTNGQAITACTMPLPKPSAVDNPV